MTVRPKFGQQSEEDLIISHSFKLDNVPEMTLVYFNVFSFLFLFFTFGQITDLLAELLVISSNLISWQKYIRTSVGSWFEPFCIKGHA